MVKASGHSEAEIITELDKISTNKSWHGFLKLK
jgi:hypothetical protein